MPTPAIGELRPLANGFEARIRIDDKGTRKGFALLGVPPTDETAARTRCTAMAEIAVRVRRAGHAEQLLDLLKMAARARAGKPWDAILVAVDAIATEGGVTPLSEARRITVADFGKKWRSGDLHREHPDHVPEIDQDRNDVTARVYVDPIIGDRRVAELTLEDAEEVMAKVESLGRAIPGGKSSSTRRHVAQYVRRILVLSVYPARIRTDNPIPKGWLPRIKDSKAKECLYPEEDRALLLCPRVPLLRRLAYGFLAREGMRTDELSRVQWRDIDLQRGKIYLDENKTDDPRDWVLDPGVCRGLATWKERYCSSAKADDRVFADAGVPVSVEHLAEQFRADLKRANVTRPQLFERSATRRPIRAHDLRATFVTVSLANGKTETWVSDRTGHTSSTMINRYRRKARTWTGLSLGSLDPLDVAIPELAPSPPERPMPGGSGDNSGDLGSPDGVESSIDAESETLGESLGSSAVRCRGSSPLPCTNEDLGASVERAPHEHGAMMGQSTSDPLEAALTRALDAAAAAGRFDVVASIVRELEARGERITRRRSSS